MVLSAAALLRHERGLREQIEKASSLLRPLQVGVPYSIGKEGKAAKFTKEGRVMGSTRMRTIAIVTALVSALSGGAMSAQDKNAVKVPGGLAFAEFKGYEGWEFISLSKNDQLVAAILGNPAMIEAYKKGIPGNGKPFPDGAKMAKIHWTPKQSEKAPAPTTVPGTLHDVDFMVKDSKRFPEAAGGDMPRSSMTPRPVPSRLKPRTTCRRS